MKAIITGHDASSNYGLFDTQWVHRSWKCAVLNTWRQHGLSAFICCLTGGYEREREGLVACVCVCVKDSNYPHSMWTELYCSVGYCAANILPPPVFLLIWTVSVHTSWTVLLIHILSFNFCTRFVSLHNITRSMGQRKDGKTHTVFLIKGQRHHCVCRPCVADSALSQVAPFSHKA